MTITSSAGAGVQVTSAAKDSTGAASTLGSQTSALANEVIVPDAITANNEGNLESSPTYVGRLCQIREDATGAATVTINNGGSSYAVNDVLTDNGGGVAPRRARFLVTSVSGGVIDGIKIHEAGDAGSPAVTVGADRGEYTSEGTLTGRATTGGSGTGATVDLTFQDVDEYRYVIADASNTLTVHEDWIDGPAQSENWRVCYIIQDVATVTGLSLINKRVSDYSSSRRLSVIVGGWLAFLNGVSLETVDNSSTSVADFAVQLNGRFDNGYSAEGVPVSGGYVIGTPAVSGEFVFNALSGSIVNFYDMFITCVNSNFMQMRGDLVWDRVKLFRPERIEMLQNTNSHTNSATINDLRIQWDQDNIEDYLNIGNTRSFGLSNLLLIGANVALYVGRNRTLETFFDVPGFITIRGIQFVDCVRDVMMPYGEDTTGFSVMKLVNSIGWSVDTTVQEQINFAGGYHSGSNGFALSRNKVLEAYETNFTIIDGAGAAIADATVHVVEGDVTENIVAGTSEDGSPTSTDTDGKYNADVIGKLYTDQATGQQFGPDGTNGIDINDVSSTVVSFDRNDGGSFITDGFAVGNYLRAYDTSDYSTRAGSFEITAVAAGTITCNDTVNQVTSGVAASTTFALQEVDLGEEVRGTFGFRAYKYGKVPFIRPLVSLTQSEPVPVTLVDDGEITEATQATAITNGDGIIVDRHPTPVRGPFNVQSATAVSGGITIDLASYAVPASLTNSILVVTVSGQASPGDAAVTGVDFGVGVDALTLANESEGGGEATSIWYLINPANATRTIRATYTGTTTNRVIQAFYITNAAQTTPIDQNIEDEAWQPNNDTLTITPTVSNSLSLLGLIADSEIDDKKFTAQSPGMRSVGLLEIDDTVDITHTYWTRILPTTDTAEHWVHWPYLTGSAPVIAQAHLVNFEPDADTQPIKVVNYDGGTGTVPTVGETITINNAGADTTGTLVEYIGDAVSGTLVLSNWNGTAPENDVNVTGGTSSFDATTHTSGGGSFDEEYTWLVDCDSKAMTVVYDYLLAKMSEAGTSLDSEFRDAIIWGEGEQSQLVYATGTGYFTERNVNRAEGVWLANRGAGTIDYMTSDGGVQFVPPVEIAVTFTGLRDNTEVRVYTANDPDDELAGVENATDGIADDRSVTFSIAASTVVDIRFAHGTAADGDRYTVPDRNSILDFTWPATATSIPITQVLDRTYNNP